MADDEDTKRAIAYRTISEEEWRVMKPNERIAAMLNDRVPPDSVINPPQRSMSDTGNTDATKLNSDTKDTVINKFLKDAIPKVLVGLFLAIPFATIGTYIVRLIAPPQAVPMGAIVAWSGKGQLPDGWVECDGTNDDVGAPDLKGLFLKGVGSKSEASHKADKLFYSSNILVDPPQYPHTPLATSVVHPSSDNEAINLPPNYTVIYIMKVK
jgi:hypothetical protein